MDCLITSERPSESGSHTCVFNCSKLNSYACTPSSRFLAKNEGLRYHNYAFTKACHLKKLLEHSRTTVAHFFHWQHNCARKFYCCYLAIYTLHTEFFGFLLKLADRMHSVTCTSKLYEAPYSKGLRQTSTIELQMWYLAFAGLWHGQKGSEYPNSTMRVRHKGSRGYMIETPATWRIKSPNTQALYPSTRSTFIFNGEILYIAKENIHTQLYITALFSHMSRYIF